MAKSLPGELVSRTVLARGDGPPEPPLACTRRFHLAGFAYAEPGPQPSEIATYDRSGLGDGLVITPADLSPAGPTSPGVWANLDTSRVHIAISQAANPIGTGTVGGQVWHVRASLGLFGQCYTTTTRGGGGRGQGLECVPVAAPPRAAALDWVSLSAARSQLTGYAGVVNPRTAKVVITLSDGTIPAAHVVNVAGRAYIAFAVPPGCQVLSLSLTTPPGTCSPARRGCRPRSEPARAGVAGSS